MLTSCVLIVEDDADLCDLVSKVLEKSGFQTIVATTLAEAFRLLAGRPFCVLLDLALPDGNGVEVLRLVRRMDAPIKVAVLTGSDDRSHLGTALLLKPDAFFRKPVQLSQLVDWITSVLPKRSKFALQPCPLGVYDRTR